MNPYKTLSAWHKHNVEVMRANAHGENLVYCASLGTASDFAVKEESEVQPEGKEERESEG